MKVFNILLKGMSHHGCLDNLNDQSICWLSNSNSNSNIKLSNQLLIHSFRNIIMICIIIIIVPFNLIVAIIIW